MCNKLTVKNSFLLLALWCTSLATSNTAQDVQKIEIGNLTEKQNSTVVTIEFIAAEGKQLTNENYIKIRHEIIAALSSKIKEKEETSFHPGYNESDVKFVLIEPEVVGEVHRVTLVPRDGSGIELDDFLKVIQGLSEKLKTASGQLSVNDSYPRLPPVKPTPDDITSTSSIDYVEVISSTEPSEPPEITSTSASVIGEVKPKTDCNWECWLPILVSVLVLILLLLLLVCLVCYRKKRRRMLPITDSDSEDEVVDRLKPISSPKTGSAPPIRHPNGLPTPPGGVKQIDDKDGWIVPLSEFKDDDYKGFESVRF